MIGKFRVLLALLIGFLWGCSEQNSDGETVRLEQADKKSLVQQEYPLQNISISRSVYADKLYGFWLAQNIANWTGLVTEMDKIGGEGIHGEFYTREDWGKADQPSIWGEGIPSELSTTIDFVLLYPGEVWGSDDDTDIEYIYQHLLYSHQTSMLTPEQIRDGWLKHIYSEQNTRLTLDGKADNFLWVSNQRAHDLMLEGFLPPDTGHPDNNPHYEMIDAQLTTEIFGLYAPGRPDIALKMAHLPIQTTARENAQWIAQFYVVLHSLAARIDIKKPIGSQMHAIADIASQQLPEGSYSAHMYRFVLAQYQQGKPWEQVRDALYQKYQVNQEAGYDISAQNLYCNGCFAAGINFAASLISYFYGEGDLKETIKIAVLAGWDSDNPAATWGGLLGFIYGKRGVEDAFGRKLADQYNIHRTRANFPNNGLDNFIDMASRGLEIVDRVVTGEMAGQLNVKTDSWQIPLVGETELN